jgi:hypothetical protein
MSIPSRSRATRRWKSTGKNRSDGEDTGAANASAVTSAGTSWKKSAAMSNPASGWRPIDCATTTCAPRPPSASTAVRA